MQIHRGLEHGFVLAFPASGRQHRRFAAAPGEAFLNRMNERRMRADFQPDIDAEVRQRVHGGRELHRLPHPSPPVRGVARLAGAPLAGHRAEKRHRFRLRLRSANASSKASEAGRISG